MPDTRYLRERPTRAIDDTTLAAIAAQIVGPPGQLGHLPPNPARFRLPASHSTRRGPLLAGGGLLLLTLWAGVITPSTPARATARLLTPATAPATVPPPATATGTATATTTATATVTVTASATATASATVTATTTSLPAATATPTMRPTLPARPTVRPVARPVSPPPATATRLPLPVATAAPPTLPPTVLPPFPATPGSGAAGNDWDSAIYSRSATVHAAPPTATP